MLALTPNLILVSGAIVSFLLSAALGGNDVANAMGTSVGSGAVSVKTALAIGAVMEFAGAVLLGSRVTETIGGGVIVVGTQGVSNPVSALSYMLGMFSVLMGSTLWLAIATSLGLPVSSTHSVVGGLIGFGLSAGWEINYSLVLRIMASWIISPFFGGTMTLLIYGIFRMFIFNKRYPSMALKRLLPFLVAAMLFVLCFFLLMKNGTHDASKTYTIAVGVSTAAAGLVAALVQNINISETLPSSNPVSSNKDTELVPSANTKSEETKVEHIFSLLQLTTACFVAFSHGSNDVSNAIGPFVALYSLWKTYPLLTVANVVETPWWILVMGGLGLSTGLALFGKSVMETVGKKITHLVPSKGFCVEFSTAMTVLLASELGLPISTTHTLIGCIVVIGLTSWGEAGVDMKVIRSILWSWFITLPVSALLSMFSFLVLKHWLP
eukprot:jgi/Galph1/31/GphlegSOOS_G4784.1